MNNIKIGHGILELEIVQHYNNG